ncbi:MAG: hypothetical protein R3C44_05355 [Chloroflexota bacterium]
MTPREAIAAGLDFIIVTDHNVWVRGVEGLLPDRQRPCAAADWRRSPQRAPPAASLPSAGLWGKGRVVPYAADPQQLISETLTGGLLLSGASPRTRSGLINSPDLGWHDWEIEGTGLEILELYVQCQERGRQPSGAIVYQNKLIASIVSLRMALRPETAVLGPEPETLKLWDGFWRPACVAAVGNADAHATPMRLGPIERIIYPYEFLFRAVNTHLLIPRELNGDIEHDRALILRAIGRGHSWVGYDMPHPTRGFRYTVQGERRGHMGDEMVLGTGATIQISTPARCHIRLIRHGEVVAEAERATNLAYIPTEPGAYRVECLIEYEGRERGWIYSNPIYLR